MIAEYALTFRVASLSLDLMRYFFGTFLPVSGPPFLVSSAYAYLLFGTSHCWARYSTVPGYEP